MWMRATLILLLVLTSACVRAPAGPVPVQAGDMCAHCKMAISEKRFASEMLDNDGNPHKFDDIGCMKKFVEQGGWMHKGVSLFVMDYDKLNWLPAGEALCVTSSSIASPMASGLLAVAEASRADQHAQRFTGRIMKCATLFQ